MKEIRMTDIYDELEKTLLAEVEESESNPIINTLINQSLKNTSEATDFDIWTESTVRTIESNLKVIEEWSLMKRSDAGIWKFFLKI
jgi:hypothetical protein